MRPPQIKKVFVQQRKQSTKRKGNLPNERKYSQIILSHKGLISKIYKEFTFNSKKKKKKLIVKKADDLNRHFFPKKTYRWPTDA